MVQRGGRAERSTRPLLERDRERASIASALEATKAGEGRLVVVEGAPGLGKSSLLAVAQLDANAAGLLTFRASGREQEQSFSFGGVLQLFESWLAALPPSERDEILSGAARLAVQLFDGARDGDGSDPHLDSIYPMLHALFWTAANIAARRPAVLLVDDLQWVDDPTVRYLVYLANRLGDLPLTVVAASRPGEAAVAGDLVRHELATRLRLAPLSRAAVVQVLALGLEEPPSDAFSDACFGVTRGNPFFVEEVVKALREEHVAPDDEHASQVKNLRTDDLEHYLAVRVSKLGADATRLASSVAVLGDGTPVQRAAELAGLETEGAVRAADRLARADLFLRGAELSFAHPLTRGAVYDQIPPVQRARWHLRAARMLADQGAGSEVVGSHLLLAPAGEDAWAVAGLERAAEEARRRGSLHSSLAYTRRALDETMDPPRRGALLLSLSRLESALGEGGASQHAEEALHLVDPAQRAEAYKVIGDCHYVAGRFGDAARAFEGGLAALDDPASPLARGLHAGFFSAASVDIEYAPRATTHIGGLPDGLPAGETPAERAVLAMLSAGLWMSGAPASGAVEAARRAWRDGSLLKDEGPEGWGWSLLTAVLSMCDELETALEVAESAMAAARKVGSPMAYATASFCAITPAFRAGRIGEALSHVEAVTRAMRDGWSTFLCSAEGVRATVLLACGELEAAEEALRIADDPRHLQSVERTMVLDARGNLRLLQGRDHEALADFTAAGDILERSHQKVSFFEWRAGAALAAHRLGERERAAELAEEALSVAEASGTPSHVARVLRVRALISDRERAVELLERALCVLDASEARLEHLYALADYGAALRRSGRRREAKDHLEQAMDTARRFGAHLVAQQVLGELRIAGSRPRRLALTGTDALTAGERRVAEMAADGLSNREIAQALFVTTRAVEKHLYATYQKLGIRTRQDLQHSLSEGASS